ncbi:2-acylglycerol O-acyltransferase 2-like [Babylonia areolata]|uniref:2-acylglycerol O-acyltransferase 2-like n=1 Tax=Babylonia areolata TaxID=304850 RepID=UPI003FD05234
MPQTSAVATKERRTSLKKASTPKSSRFKMEGCGVVMKWMGGSWMPGLKQWLAVWQFSMLFVFGGWSCVLLMFCLLFTQYWYLTLVYAAWFYYDRKTHLQGGRGKDSVRRWRLWKHYRDYFPITLIKTCDLDPSRNYIFPCHPHGVMCFAPFLHFSTEASGFSDQFPGLEPHLMTLSIQYKYPLFREYMMCSGAVDVAKESIEWHLHTHPKGGQALAIIVGGAPEAMEAQPGSTVLKIKERKGFIKMALKHGASLVPVYSFGENELFNMVESPEGSLGWWFQQLVMKIFGYNLPIFCGRSKFFFTVPFRRPVYSVVGEPVHVEKVEEPSREQVEDLHRRYVSAVTSLFEKYKHLGDTPQDQHLIIS